MLDASDVAAGLWNRVELIAGFGDDVVVGTGQDDLIDSGFGNDRVSGLGGTDTFVDAGGTDTIVESAQADFGLYGNLLVIGTALIGGSGANRAVTGFTSATAEDISMFESAILTGWSYRLRYTGVGTAQALSGGERNVFAVGTASGSLLVNGTTAPASSPGAGSRRSTAQTATTST